MPINPIRGLINELSKLPGIGEKTASRLAFFILSSDGEYANQLASSILKVKTSIQICGECFQFTEETPCEICSDHKRDAASICVVEQPSDLLAIERTGDYHGLYHVLHGALSPLSGIGPDQIRARELIQRIDRSSNTKEIILATNSDAEGEATALYISKLLSPCGIVISKIASGIPVGSDLEYADQVTLSRALQGRQRIQ